MAPQKRRRVPDSSCSSSSSSSSSSGGGGSDPSSSDSESAAAGPQDRTWWENVIQLFTSCHAPASFTNARAEHAALLNEVLAPKNGKDCPHKALFLHGPPGSGKTALTTATLRKCKNEQRPYKHLTCTNIRQSSVLLEKVAQWLNVTGDGTVVGTWKPIVAYFTQPPVACADTDYLDKMRSVDLSEEAEALGFPLSSGLRKAEKLAALQTHLQNLDKEALAQKTAGQLSELGKRLGIEGLAKQRSQKAKLEAILGGRRPERCVLVLDEVDFFFGKKRAGTKGGVRLAGQAAQGVPDVTTASTCADVVAALVGLALSKANTQLVTVLISNEETEAHQAIRMIPKDLRLHFAPYNKQQLLDIICERLRELDVALEDVILARAVDLLVLRAINSGNGDCRTLLENVRRTLALKLEKGKPTNREAIGMMEASAATKKGESVYLWLKSVGDNARLFVVTCLIVRARKRPPYKLDDIGNAYATITARFLNAHDASLEMLLRLLQELSCTHEYVRPVFGGGAKGRTAGKKAARLTANAHTKDIEVAVQEDLDPHLVYNILRRVAQEDGTLDGQNDFLLGNVMRHYELVNNA